MNKRAILAATAMLFTSFTPVALPPLVAPAFADAASDAQALCDELLQPNNPNSEFFTYPGNLVEGTWVTVGSDLGDPIGDPYGVGIPTPSGTVFDGTYIRHGGSPNVWGGATSTLTYPQTGQLFETVLHQERTNTFDCVVEKFVGNGDEKFPPGLQRPGQTDTEQQDIAGPNEEVITDDDFVVTGETVDVLICISPNNITKSKPGTWVQKHGFTGSCTTASTIAGTSFIPSHNNPTTDPDISH